MLAMLVLQGVLVTYANGNEIGREKYSDDGNALVSHLSLMGREATVTVTRKPRHATVEMAGTKVEREVEGGTIVLENLAWQEYALAAEWFPSATQPIDVQVLVPGQGVKVAGTLQVEPLAGGGKRVNVTIHGALVVHVTVDKDGRVVAAEVPAQKLVVKPEGAAAPVVVKRKPPEGITEEEITVERPEATLRGVVWLPRAATKKTPLAVIVAGSGPTDRDGNSNLGLETDCYRLLAEALVKKGIAVARYDKRGVGASSVRQDPAKMTIDDFVADAGAIVAWGRKSGRFGKVTVIGHSEGGVIAALLGKTDEKPDAIVSLDGPGRPLGVVLREQLSTKIGADEMKRFEEIMAALRAGKPLGDVPESLRLLFLPSVQAFVRSVIDVDAAKVYASEKIRLTIVQGDADAQVSVEDAKELHKARPDAKLHVIHDCNHVLKTETSKALPQKSYNDVKLPLCNGVVDAVLDGIAR